MPERHVKFTSHLRGASRLWLCGALLLSGAAGEARADAPRQDAARPAAEADDDEVARGQGLLAQGKAKEAGAVLLAATKRRKDDPEAWHYLGVAHNYAGDPKEARKAFERALKLRPGHADSVVGLAYALANSNKLRDAEREARRALELAPQNREAHYVMGVVALRAGKYQEALAGADEALRLGQSYAPAQLLKSQALVGLYTEHAGGAANRSPDAQRERLGQAADALEEFLRLNPARAGEDAWREQLDALRVYSQSQDIFDPERKVFSTGEVDQKAVILRKPEPGYTERARQNGTEGVVRVRAVLAADATVKHVLVLRGLHDGLTERCVRAARGIKFTPAVKDGRPVSMAVMIEYNFNVY